MLIAPMTRTGLWAVGTGNIGRACSHTYPQRSIDKPPRRQGAKIRIFLISLCKDTDFTRLLPLHPTLRAVVTSMRIGK